MSTGNYAVIVPSRNEGAWLARTIQSIRRAEGGIPRIVHVNDASESETPEPDLSEFGVREITLPDRMGAARARAYGMIVAFKEYADIEAVGTVDAHQLYGEGDALAGFVEELQRFQTIDGVARNPEYIEYALHMATHKIRRMVDLAILNNGISYAGPCRMGPSTVRWHNGLMRAEYVAGGNPKWLEHAASLGSIETAAANGGNYFFSREAYRKIGGYPQLPGMFGFEEEALAFLAAATGVKVVCASNISPWHVFRSQGVDPVKCPYTTSEAGQLSNLAGVYRLCFSEKMWKGHWRKVLSTVVLPGRIRSVPVNILDYIETNDQYTRYRDMVQRNFIRHDDDLLAELESRRVADRNLYDSF